MSRKSISRPAQRRSPENHGYNLFRLFFMHLFLSTMYEYRVTHFPLCMHFLLVFQFPGGYKGFGLAMMVDMFCGILSGSEFGTNIKRWQGEEKRVQNLVTVNLKLISVGPWLIIQNEALN